MEKTFMKRVYLVISGDVQGVGYRAWVWREAKNLGAVGWVRNREDGAVEVVAEGEEVKLRKLVELCRKGPEVAWVEHLQETWSTARNEFVTFEIRY